MSVDQMREAITKVYPAERWQKKVAKMDDVQVMAIYFKFAQCGKLEKPVVSMQRRCNRDYIHDQMAAMGLCKVADATGQNGTDGCGYAIHQITFDEMMRQK